MGKQFLPTKTISVICSMDLHSRATDAKTIIDNLVYTIECKEKELAEYAILWGAVNDENKVLKERIKELEKQFLPTKTI